MSGDLLNSLQQEMRACHRCFSEGYQIVPGAIFSGDAAADILVIGQAPGITEVAAKRPFNAGSGQRLFQWLAGAGIVETTFRRTQYMTAVTKCYPGKSRSGKGDRVPSRHEQSLCRPYLARELELVNPRLIVPVGSLAIGLFFKKTLKLADVIGRAAFWGNEPGDEWPQFDATSLLTPETPLNRLPMHGRWIIPLPHPSGASLWPNRPENRRLIDQAIAVLDEIIGAIHTHED